MHNVMIWRKNQIKYAAKHQVELDSPENDQDVESASKLMMFDKIEEQFSNKKFKFSENDQFSAKQS